MKHSIADQPKKLWGTFPRRIAASCLLGALLVLAGPGVVQAQTNCSPLTLLQNNWATTTPTSDGTSGGWNTAGSSASIVDDFTKDALPLVTAFNSTQQPVQGGVVAGSTIKFNLSWNNGNNAAFEGIATELQVLYNGVVYANFFTPARGEADTVKIASAQGGANLAISSAWNTLPAGSNASITITLPPGVASSGELMFRARRNQTSGTAPANGSTDDFRMSALQMQSPSLCLRKVSTNGTGTFNFTATNSDTDLGTPGPQSTAAITTATSGTIVAFDAWPNSFAPSSAGTNPIVVQDLNQPVTITETGLPAGATLTNVICTGGANANFLPASNTAIITGITASILPTTCTFFNTMSPVLRLNKSLPSGRSLAGDQFTLSIEGPGGPASVTTTGTGSTAIGSATLTPTVGATYTLSEAAAGTTILANYNSSINCTNATAGSNTLLPSGSASTYSVTPAQGDNISCTLSNTANPVADLSVAKTVSPVSAQTGSTVTYTLTVNNAGPTAASNAVLRDAPGAGLNCSQAGLAAPTCNASGGAACPNSGLTNAALTSGNGVAIPTLPAGGQVAVQMQCVVTATGS